MKRCQNHSLVDRLRAEAKCFIINRLIQLGELPTRKIVYEIFNTEERGRVKRTPKKTCSEVGNGG
jgi:hypothetical protein